MPNVPPHIRQTHTIGGPGRLFDNPPPLVEGTLTMRLDRINDVREVFAAFLGGELVGDSVRVDRPQSVSLDLLLKRLAIRDQTVSYDSDGSSITVSFVSYNAPEIR